MSLFFIISIFIAFRINGIKRDRLNNFRCGLRRMSSNSLVYHIYRNEGELRHTFEHLVLRTVVAYMQWLICGTMGKDVLSIRTAQHWFHRFKNGNFELDDLSHSGRPLQVNMDLLKELIEQDPRLTTRCLAECLGCSHIAIETHLHELGKT